MKNAKLVLFKTMKVLVSNFIALLYIHENTKHLKNKLSLTILKRSVSQES